MVFARLFATLSLALLCVASPVVVRDSHVKLPLARRFNYTGTATLPGIDRARARALVNKVTNPPAPLSKAAAQSVPVTNIATIYTVAVCFSYH